MLSRWRDEARRDPEQAVHIHQPDDQELQDHLPALTDKIIDLLRGKPVADLEEEAAEHGRQRRAMGYGIVPLVGELQIYRRVLLDMVQELVGNQISPEEIANARKLIIDTIDRSMNVSSLQYTLAAQEERDSAQGAPSGHLD